MGERTRSFSDPDTLFELVRSDTPVWDDGFKMGEPTGEVVCEGCGASAAAPEYINHDKDCSQRDVTSEWYDELH
ncbi:hypothetical protein [Halosimplex pelagicum]|uniref:Uncharacterized protein n=1 Tax=Halosimplex pelagicum TaxID=869886 RepID=A0A7D5P820_9EURY|nr:hypothetical protein [Halosimplex pelagicum]QLH81004.1 hypothetical protein HZS54_04850 [Halosimplex pelagicum]